MRIAKLRSGCEFPYIAKQSLTDFSLWFSSLDEADQFDVCMIMQYLIVRYRRMGRKSYGSEVWWTNCFALVLDNVSKEFLGNFRSELGLHSYQDQLNFAHHMIDNFWRIIDF